MTHEHQASRRAIMALSMLVAPLSCIGAPPDAALPAAGASAAASSAAAAEKKISATLTVTVHGNHLPVARADVQVSPKVPPPGWTDHLGMTDLDGRARLPSMSAGEFTVRVIATGWKTTKPPITLKPGDNQMTIELEPAASHEEKKKR